VSDDSTAALREQLERAAAGDAEAWRRLLEKGTGKARAAVAQQIQHWLGDADLAGVRGAAALGKLPAAERPRWQQLWEAAAALQRRAAASPAAPGGGREGT
jgi:hypothetical protein